MTSPILPVTDSSAGASAPTDSPQAPAPSAPRKRPVIDPQLFDAIRPRSDAGHAELAPRAVLPPRPPQPARPRNRGPVAAAPRQPDPEHTRLRPELAEIEREAEQLKPTRAVAPAERLRATATGSLDRLTTAPLADSPARPLSSPNTLL